MKKCLILAVIVFMHFSGCTSRKNIIGTPLNSDTVKESDKINFWLDSETDTVHKISSENGIKKVLSVVKYKEGKPLEVMKIISSDSNNNKLHWIYFVPSTKYIVELSEISTDDRRIEIGWKNRTPEGVEDSGSDILVKSNENGAVKKNSNQENDISESFSSSGEMQ